MWDTFGQDPRRSIFERFHLFMNCCNMFFHVILDWKLNVSKLAESKECYLHDWPSTLEYHGFDKKDATVCAYGPGGTFYNDGKPQDSRALYLLKFWRYSFLFEQALNLVPNDAFVIRVCYIHASIAVLIYIWLAMKKNLGYISQLCALG